ncbi:MAG: ankyrin repeat domain-containing protein [Bacteroidota bacterium]
MKNTLLSAFAVIAFLFTSTGVSASQEDFFKAAKECNVEGINNALNAGANVNALFEDGRNALIYTIFSPEATKLLLDKGCDPNGGNYPAVIQAGTFYSTEVMKMLLDAGADPNKPGLTDPSATFKTLIANEKAKGKSANQALIDVWSKVMVTAKPSEIYALPTIVSATNCVPCVEMLLAKGASVEKGVTDGTLLHTFASFGNSREERKAACAASKEVLAGFGLIVPAWYLNLPEDRNGTAEAMLKVLLSKGLDINGKNNANGIIKPQTPLEVALSAGMGSKKDVMVALINNGADVKIVHDVYGPVIFQAAQTGLVEVVKAMVDKGADLNMEGKFFGQSEGALLKGYTPLSIAALYDRLDLVKYLLSAGAKSNQGVEGKFINPKTNCFSHVTDKTAIYYAIENGNMEMVKAMVESGEKWWTRLKIHDIKTRSTGYNAIGQQVETIKCFGAGEYLPSMYAKECKYDDIKTLLKSKGI